MKLGLFAAYLRGLGWQVWALTALTALAILAFCGWIMGLIILAVALVALAPVVRIGMRAEAEKRRRTGRD
jgi:uncharacterized membrane protein